MRKLRVKSRGGFGKISLALAKSPRLWNNKGTDYQRRDTCELGRVRRKSQSPGAFESPGVERRGNSPAPGLRRGDPPEPVLRQQELYQRCRGHRPAGGTALPGGAFGGGLPGRAAGGPLREFAQGQGPGPAHHVPGPGTGVPDGGAEALFNGAGLGEVLPLPALPLRPGGEVRL